MSSTQPITDAVPMLSRQVQELGRQIHFMKAHCAGQGIAIPKDLATMIAGFESKREALTGAADDEPPPRPTMPPANPEVGPELVQAPAAPPDTEADRELALAKRRAGTLKEAYIEGAAVHAQLASLVKPATPAAIEWTSAPANSPEGRKRRRFISIQLGFALLFLVSFVAMIYIDHYLESRDRENHAVLTLAEGLTEIDPATAGESTTGLVVASETARALAATADANRERIGQDRNLAALLSEISSDARDIEKTLTPLLERQPSGQPLSEGERKEIADQLLAMAGQVRQYRAVLGLRAAAAGGPNGFPDYILLVIAGGLGAAFYNLYKAHDFIVNRMFDQAHVARYYSRMILGSISGLILGHFGGEMLRSANAEAMQGNNLVFSRAFLALLGGVAVDAVFLVLVRIAGGITALFRGDPRAMEQAQKEVAATRAEQAYGEKTRSLVQGLQKIRESTTDPNAQKELDKQISALLG